MTVTDTAEGCTLLKPLPGRAARPTVYYDIDHAIFDLSDRMPAMTMH